MRPPAGPWLALWLALPVAASPAFCLLLALDAGALVGLDAAAAREVAIGLTLDLFRLWIAATLAAAAAIALAVRRKGAPACSVESRKLRNEAIWP